MLTARLSMQPFPFAEGQTVMAKDKGDFYV